MEYLPQVFGSVLGIVIFAFIVALAIYWLLFPLMVYSRLNKLIKLIEVSNAQVDGRALQLIDGITRLNAPAVPLPPKVAGYYVRLENETSGPFPAEKIRELRTRGAIDDSSLIAREGTKEWTKLSEAGV